MCTKEAVADNVNQMKNNFITLIIDYDKVSEVNLEISEVSQFRHFLSPVLNTW